MSAKFTSQLLASIHRKQKKNPKFSLRLMAKQLGISHSFLSQVLSGKKQFPLDRIDALIDVLELDEFAKRRLLENVIDEQIDDWKTKSKALGEHLEQTVTHSKLSVRVYEEIPPSKMSLVNPWFNMAILDLVESQDFSVNYSWISKRLGVSTFQAQAAWAFLTEQKFVIEDNGRWKKSDLYLRMPVLKSSEPIRQHYLQILGKMEEQLKKKTSDADLKRRMIVGATCTANSQKLDEVKQYLEDSLYIAAEELAEGDCSEVYYLMVSAIPLTKILQ